MSAAYTFELPAPPPCLSPNSRSHWRVKANATAKCRGWSRACAMGAARCETPRHKTASVQLTYFVRDKRRRDADNALARAKSIFDGMTDAGLIADDSGLTHLPVLFVVDKDRAGMILVKLVADDA